MSETGDHNDTDSGTPEHGKAAPGTPPPQTASAADKPVKTPPRNPWGPPSTGHRRPVPPDPAGRAHGANSTGLAPPSRRFLPRGIMAASLWRQVFQLPMRANGGSWWPILLAGTATVGALASATHQLDSGEQGLVTTLGSYSHDIGPGLSFTLPWPIALVSVSNVNAIHREVFPEGDVEQLMLTRDQGLVDLRFTLRWNIRNLKQYTYQIDDTHRILREVAEAEMRASIAEMRLDEAMNGSTRGQIAAKARLRIQQKLDAYQAGVQLVGLDIDSATPPARLGDAEQKVVLARQDAARDMADAQSYAQKAVTIAQTDAATFDKAYAQYKLAPDVTRRRMYYDTMDRVLATNDKIIVPQGTNNWLPMPDLKHKPQEPAQGAGQ